jgi:hypothetical protein
MAIDRSTFVVVSVAVTMCAVLGRRAGAFVDRGAMVPVPALASPAAVPVATLPGVRDEGEPEESNDEGPGDNPYVEPVPPAHPSFRVALPL